MPKEWSGSWSGGRTYKRGRRTIYVIQKMRAGIRYNLHLEARDLEQAEKELGRFEGDPAGYRARLEPKAPPGRLVMDDKSIQTVIDWQKTEGQSSEHIYGTALYLKQWAKFFAGQDINTVTLAQCEQALTDWGTARKMRIVAFKTFCTRHVKLGTIPSSPAARLEVPPSIAAKNFEPRHYTIEEVERAYAHTNTQVQRDLIQLACKTGLHMTEIERFAEGIGRLVETPDQGEIAGVIWVLQKSGKQHPNSIDAAALAAAKRIREAGRVPDRPKRHEFAVRLAKRLTLKLGVEVRPVQYGALRHSFVTWARSKGGRIVKPKDYGVTLDEIRDAVGHRSTRTTDKYDGTEVPPMIVGRVKLFHESDPHVVETAGVPSASDTGAGAGPGRRNRRNKAKKARP